uniref:Uncharacterized protein n=1 Tax=Castor canadensis TaxID=51338 RepID=A0A8C0W122_CASCN
MASDSIFESFPVYPQCFMRGEYTLLSWTQRVVWPRLQPVPLVLSWPEGLCGVGWRQHTGSLSISLKI